MAKQQKFFYGWILVGVGLVCYGFGISPAYYSWGFFGPEMREDLGLTRAQTGSVFGWFQFTFSVVGPLVGIAIGRFGIRAVMTAGSLVCAVGFYLVSRAQTVWDCYIAYSLIGGAGIGFSTIIPNQALAAQWFVRYRARAMAIIFTGGALVGMAVNPFNAAMLATSGWRDAWVIIAGVSVIVTVLAALLVRDSPESLGMTVDGAPPAEASGASASTSAAAALDLAWTAGKAVRTPQFLMITVAGVAYSVPWGVVSAHGGLHLREELGIPAVTAAIILSTVRVGASAAGRLSGSAGDFMAPPRLLSLALMVEALGVAILALARSEVPLYAGVVLLGLGFGAAYITVPVVFADFYGRRAFATTTGTRIMINSIFGLLAPILAGVMADRADSYVPVFWLMSGITLIGAVAAFFCRKPAPPQQAQLVSQAA